MALCLSLVSSARQWPFPVSIEKGLEFPVLGMDETGSQKDAALSLSDGGPLRQVRHPGGLESEGLTLRSGSILRGRRPHTSQMSDSQALTEFGMVTVQGQTGLSPSERETVTSYTVSAAAADLSHAVVPAPWWLGLGVGGRRKL